MDPLSLCVGALLVAAGWLAGWRTRRATRVPAVDACGCAHPLALHNRKTDACAGQLRRKRPFGRTGFEYVACPCQRYTGLPTLDDVIRYDPTRTEEW